MLFTENRPYYYGICAHKMAIRYICKKCKVELSGDGASRHYLAFPDHKLVKLPSLASIKKVATAA